MSQRQIESLKARRIFNADNDAHARIILRQIQHAARSAGSLEILRNHIDRLTASLIGMDKDTELQLSARVDKIAATRYADEPMVDGDD